MQSLVGDMLSSIVNYGAQTADSRLVVSMNVVFEMAHETRTAPFQNSDHIT